MNKNNILLLTIAIPLVLLMLVAGCSKDFLEKPKGGAVTEDTIFTTQNQARKALAHVYYTSFPSIISYDWNQSRPGVITDEVYLLHGKNDNWAGSLINTERYVVGSMGTENTSDRGTAERNDGGTTGFGSHYASIRTANLVLKNIDRVMDADAAWITDVKGQALFCRAYQHYELFRQYGGIPIVTNPLEGNNLKVARSSIKSVVDTLVSWCDKAASMLPPTRPSVDYGRATKLAALALKARVLLYAASPQYNTPSNLEANFAGARFGDARDSVLKYDTYDANRWKLAADAAKAVIDNSGEAGVALYNTNKPLTTGDTYATLGDYESVWNVFANKELIFVNTKDKGDHWNNWWSNFMNNKVRESNWGVKNSAVEFIQLYEKNDGTPWTMPATGNDLPVFIQGLNLDPRFYQSICYDGMFYSSAKGYLDYYKEGDGYPSGQLASADGIDNGLAFEVYKFTGRVDNMNDNHFSTPIFRLAEFYLSYAEALNEFSGPSGAAYDALNLIRSRAGMPPKSGLDNDGFRKAIQNERTVELAFENHRYNDLYRWGEAHVVLNQNLHGVVTTAKKVNNNLKRSWEVVSLLQRIFPKKYYYLPFPNSEISKEYLGGNSWNGQNPGW